VVKPIGPDGHFLNDVGVVGGKFFKDADPIRVADLKQRGCCSRL
jgi:isoleucyl-tRNA synthetase